MGYKRKGGWESAVEHSCGHIHKASGSYCELAPEHPGTLHGFSPTDPNRLDVRTCNTRVWAETCCEAVPPEGLKFEDGKPVVKGTEEKFFCDMQRDVSHHYHVCHKLRDHKQAIVLRWPARHLSVVTEIHEIDVIAPDVSYADEKKLPTWQELNERDRERFRAKDAKAER